MTLDQKIALASAIGSALAGLGAFAVVLFMYSQYAGERAGRKFERDARQWTLKMRKFLLSGTYAARGSGLMMIQEVQEKDIEFVLWSVQRGFLEIAPDAQQLSIMLPAKRLTHPS